MNNDTNVEDIEFEQAQNKLYQDIGKSLIEATPEHWNSASLILEATDDSLSHSIASEEGHNDIVVPTGELYLATRQLWLLLNKHEKLFSSAVFKVWLDDSQKWKFGAEFEYDT